MSEMTRRNFIAASGAMGAAAMVASAWAGTALAEEASQAAAEGAEGAAVNAAAAGSAMGSGEGMTVAGVETQSAGLTAPLSNEGRAVSPWGDYYPWAAEAPAIAEEDVEETIDCDVAVIGMGVAGCAAFRAASEAGAKTVGIEKSWQNICRSSQYCYLNGKYTDHFGLPHLDLEAILKEEFEECNSMSNYNIVRRFVYNEAEAMDWWIEGGDCRVCEPGEEMAMGASENNVNTMSDASIDYEHERQAAYPENFNFGDHQAVLDNNVQKGLDAGTGSQVLYEHKAVELIKDESGRVCGVYALSYETDKYKRINAKNGVVMAAGCFRSNLDYVRYFTPNLIFNGNGNPWPHVDAWGVKTNSGDAYPMGYWAGASIQQYQCSQMHVMGGPGDDDSQMTSMGFTGPLLRINYNGKRFMNEDTCAADAEYPIELQPKHKCFMICDSHFEEQAAQCVNTFAAALSDWDEQVGNGTIFKGDTLEELFASIEGMDVDAALATVEHYNELCAAAEGLDPQDTSADPDYGKKAKYLFPLQDGPFYAQRMGVGLCLVMMGGLESNEEAQVLDCERQVIPGLYAAGNSQGSRFVLKYPFRLSGHSHAMAMFYGKVAGENAAAGL